MDSFTSLNAGSSNEYRIRNAQEPDPKDDNYSISDNNTNISTSNPFKKPTKTDKFKDEKGNQPNFTFKPPNSYIITEGLFTYKLLDINYSTP
jgi:hypothetical protein